MKVVGISMIRNEADIIELNVLYHLSLGIDQMLIVDNGSTDDTPRVLRKLARDKRVRWTRDDSPYLQSKITTELAREACALGADWVVPIDADEFWYSPRQDFRNILSESKAGALRVQVANFIQRRDQMVSSPAALVHATRRVPDPVGPVERTEELVKSRQIAFVEMLYPPKHISRASSSMCISAGNHSVTGVEGPIVDKAGIVCLHVPLRSRSMLDNKAEEGRRVDEAAWPPGLCWHLRRWRQLREAGALDLEWAANSYEGNVLDVYETEHHVIFDPTLRDVLYPWIRRPVLNWLLRLWH